MVIKLHHAVSHNELVCAVCIGLLDGLKPFFQYPLFVGCGFLIKIKEVV